MSPVDSFLTHSLQIANSCQIRKQHVGFGLAGVLLLTDRGS